MAKEVKKTILIIEDDLPLAKMYQIKLENENFEVLLATDGKKGLNLLEKLKKDKKLPDLILLDILMPKVDGYEVLKIIKKDSLIKNIPVLLLTNLPGTPEERTRGEKLGAKEYLVKSDFTPSQLVNKIKPYL